MRCLMMLIGTLQIYAATLADMNKEFVKAAALGINYQPAMIKTYTHTHTHIITHMHYQYTRACEYDEYVKHDECDEYVLTCCICVCDV